MEFDRNDDGSIIEGYASEIDLRKTKDSLRLDEEVRRSLSKAFPEQSASLRMIINAQKSHRDYIFLLANEIYGSLALKTATKVIEEARNQHYAKE